MPENESAWHGELFLSRGWAHYRGTAGDTAMHAHYPVQLVFSPTTPALVKLETHELKGTVLTVASNVPHLLQASKHSVDLLYIEPTLIHATLAEVETAKDGLIQLNNTSLKIDDQRIVRALKTVDDALGTKIHLDMVARAAGLSKSNFTALFRSVVGMPLRRYVLWRRLNLAVAAMGDGADATTAAHVAGFSDSAHFSRTMKKMFGVSPSGGLRGIKLTVSLG